MKNYFDLAAKRHEEIQKEAFAGALGRAALSLGRKAVKNPGKSLGVGATAAFAPMDAKRFYKGINKGKKAGKVKAIPAKETFKAGPTY